jgi:hypothetical protein
MPLKSQEGRRWPAPLGGRVPDGAHAGQVADAVVALWREIDQALHPIIGHRGVAALYERSLRLTAAAYPWLALEQRGMPAAVDAAALHAALVQQAGAQAAAGGNALFHSFHQLLASLVGASLTERLLRSVWDHSPGAAPAQDTSS